MKKSVLSLVFCLLGIYNIAQNPIYSGYIDGDDYSGIEAETLSGNTCTYSSPYWNERLNFIPTGETPVFTVHLNLIVLQKNNGTGNFDATFTSMYDSAIIFLNYMYNNLQNLSTSEIQNCFHSNGTYGPQYIPSTKIQFSYDLYFVKNSYWWNFKNGWLCPSGEPINANWLRKLDSLINADTSIIPGINVYFPEDSIAYDSLMLGLSTSSFISAACSESPSIIDMNSRLRIYIPNTYIKYLKAIKDYPDTSLATIRSWIMWGLSSTFAHEIGHSLWLDHIAPHQHGWNECTHSIMHQAFNAPRNWLPPSEIGQMHRALHVTSIKRCISPNTYFPNLPYIVDTFQLWDFNIRAYSDIIIENNGILELTCSLQMPQKAKIIVKNGGKLLVNGGIISSYGNYLWQGIEVWGNKDLSQYTESNQGVVELKNGATIENARCAITTCQKDTDGNILWNYTGGIIHAKDANFINNRKAIEFLSYHNILPNGREIANSSYFYNCTFETNAQLSDPGTLPETFVSLYDVKGVKFLGCTFQNTAPTSVYYTKHRGNGITSVDASYEVKPLCLNPYIYPCTKYQPNTFQNLYYGIDASNTNPAITLTINGNNFDNNHRSIFLKGINNATITKNNFDVGASIGNNIRELPNEGEVCELLKPSYGVYLKECSGYKVEENNFSTTHDGHTGIIVNNSGTKANEIYS